MAGNKYNIDMTNGALLPKLLRFTLPLVAANSPQLIFHAIDLMVIGHFANPKALAAIGATSAINGMLVTFFAGIAVGTNVLTARYFGAKDNHKLHLTVHTSAAFALWGGVAMGLFAVLMAKPLLTLVETPPEILSNSALYLRVTFCGLPFVLLYNIGSAVLRAFGNTRQPLYFLVASAILKVILNLFFVIVCKFDVPGVAFSTVLSQTLMGGLILRALLRESGAGRLYWKKIRFESASLKEILRLGVPSSIQTSSYSISNVLIQSGVNSFGPMAIAGNMASGGLEGIIHVGSQAFYQAALTFTAQNHGAGKIDRVRKGILICIASGALISGVCGAIFTIFGETLLQIFTSDPEIIRYAMIKAHCLFTAYFIVGIMEAIAGSLRGLGYSTSSMITTVTGVCGIRIIGILLVFPHIRTLQCLYLSYPVSWVVVSVLNGTLLWFICRKLTQNQLKKTPNT
jgi:putative MATE family efflux protein